MFEFEFFKSGRAVSFAAQVFYRVRTVLHQRPPFDTVVRRLLFGVLIVPNAGFDAVAMLAFAIWAV